MADFYGFKPNVNGISAVLSTPAVQSMLASLSESMAATANDISQTHDAEYRAYVDMGRFVPIGKVVCGNYTARIDNAYHNTLLRARG